MGRRKKNKGGGDDFWDTFDPEADPVQQAEADAAREQKSKGKGKKGKGNDAADGNAGENGKADAGGEATAEKKEKSKDKGKDKKSKAKGGKTKGGKTKGGKPKGKAAMIAKIKAEKEARERAEAERKQREEEERLEAERQAEAERLDTQRRKEQAERDRLAAQAAAGPKLTKKERAAKAAAEARRKELIDQGLIDPNAVEGKRKKTKVRYGNKKKKTDEQKAAEAAEAAAKAAAEAAAKDEESSTPDEWDADSVSSGDDSGFGFGDDNDNDKEAESASDADGTDGPSAAADADAAGASEPERPKYRAPVCCVMGHVDTGKTKLLDKIRRTNVQTGEAGGITQQIGATFFPADAIERQTDALTRTAKKKMEMLVPGLLVIDTPGHESFSNLRSRGSSLCDIAIVVVDLMHGIEPQCVESLEMLRKNKTPFVVALNKIDRCYAWKSPADSPIYQPFKVSQKEQEQATLNEFKARTNDVIVQFAELGFNAALYYENPDYRTHISLIPTSAHTGEGIPDLLLMLVQLTQRMMAKQLYLQPELEATVLEVKAVPGLGTTIDIILVNGSIREGDEIVVCGMEGPIHTKIRALLTPHPMKELRVKTPYQHHKVVHAAQGIKISAHNLENAVAGTSLLVVGPDDDVEDLKEEVMEDMETVLESAVDKSGEGVFVKASTLGSLEALLIFLQSEGVPVNGVGLGPIHKKDVNKAAIMLDRKPRYACILAFNVAIAPDIQLYANQRGVTCFTNETIYRLEEEFLRYLDGKKQEEKEAVRDLAIFPCICNIVAVFNARNPVVLGVEVEQGVLRIGSLLCVPSKGNLEVGRVISLQDNGIDVEEARETTQVAVKFDSPHGLTVGRQFTEEDKLISVVSRDSIDVLKAHFRDEMRKSDWILIKKLKTVFNVI
ncbi:uncharacterized protein AMSG_02788 [Thecamonas trahens ATCC 50062]|uniref:Eukaryotic translation initiation factor 5B n=1 Tax=Thecamonas trahens ATCC 50062 TaxID=461836 RepID=A0A0L0D2B0_THETB|nr:hypothetical protein AMSG_02788 [Thecamonas trahens ATCC 50062]KNC46336.1 hypothetical protein AMSG_02788 [Thecamonas trahens ATCC 50062]|eukprot:XP_013760629.1 hypothetical protein AMSG_02788 [Thecamonas trahens ATCC 50062]